MVVTILAYLEDLLPLVITNSLLLEYLYPELRMEGSLAKSLLVTGYILAYRFGNGVRVARRCIYRSATFVRGHGDKM
jgi:hypothetical protein